MEAALEAAGTRFFVDENDMLLLDTERVKEIVAARNAHGELLGEPGLSRVHLSYESCGTAGRDESMHKPLGHRTPPLFSLDAAEVCHSQFVCQTVPELSDSNGCSSREKSGR